MNAGTMAATVLLEMDTSTHPSIPPLATPSNAALNGPAAVRKRKSCSDLSAVISASVSSNKESRHRSVCTQRSYSTILSNSSASTGSNSFTGSTGGGCSNNFTSGTGSISIGASVDVGGLQRNAKAEENGMVVELEMTQSASRSKLTLDVNSDSNDLNNNMNEANKGQSKANYCCSVSNCM